MAVTLPVLLTGWEWLIARKPLRSALTRTALLWILAAIVVVFRIWLIPIPAEGPYGVVVGVGAFDNLLQYLDWTSLSLFFVSDWWGGVLVVAVAVAAVALRYLTSSKLRIIALGALWFLVSIGPVVFMPNHIFDFYLTIPIMGAIIVVAAVMSAFVERVSHTGIAVGICLVIALGYAAGSYREFSDQADRRGQITDANRRIVTEILALYPEFPEHTTLHFDFRGNFPVRVFLKDQGASLRFVYSNPTLRCLDYKRTKSTLTKRRNLRNHHVFSVQPDGSINEIRGGARGR